MAASRAAGGIGPGSVSAADEVAEARAFGMNVATYRAAKAAALASEAGRPGSSVAAASAAPGGAAAASAAPASAEVGNATIDAILARGGGHRQNEEPDGHCFYRAVARQLLGDPGRYPEIRVKAAKMYAAIAGKKIVTNEGGSVVLDKDGNLQFVDLEIPGYSPEERLELILAEQKDFIDKGMREESYQTILRHKMARGVNTNVKLLPYTKEERQQLLELSAAIKKPKSNSNRNLKSSQMINIQTAAQNRYIIATLGIDRENTEQILLAYANLVCLTNIWAGQSEAYHLSPILQRNIIWFDLSRGGVIPKLRYFKITNSLEESDPNSQPIVVAWSGGNHYESIMPPKGGWKPAQLALLYASDAGHGGGRRGPRRTRRLKKSK